MTGPAFLRRPDPVEPFTLRQLAQDWSDPVEASNRRAEFDRWSSAFDALHPLNRAERDVQLLTTAGLSDREINHIMGDE